MSHPSQLSHPLKLMAEMAIIDLSEGYTFEGMTGVVGGGGAGGVVPKKRDSLQKKSSFSPSREETVGGYEQVPHSRSAWVATVDGAAEDARMDLIIVFAHD